jgi:hypothetical protein
LPSTDKSNEETMRTGFNKIAGGARGCLFAVAIAAVGVTAGCGGSGSAAPSTTATDAAAVHAPDWQLQSCTFTVDGKVPSGSPQGIAPGYPSFSPDATAGTALATVQKDGGHDLWDSFILANGTKLYAGPDTGAASVATVASGTQLLVAEPVLWTDSSGKQWLAFFVACGGPHLYWVSVDQAQGVNAGLEKQIATDTAASSSYTGSFPEHPSVQPVAVKGQQLTWKNPAIPVDVGRGMVFVGA